MRKYAWLIVIFSIIICGYTVSYIQKTPVKTEVARPYRQDIIVNASGYMIRDEVVYKTTTGGMIEGAVIEGTKVAKGRKIATVYKDGIDPTIKNELIKINSKIDELSTFNSLQNNVYITDVASVEIAIKEKCKEFALTSRDGNFERASKIKLEISELISNRQNILGEKGMEGESLTALLQQKNRLEAQISSDKQDIYSTKSGIYTSVVDGLENVLTPSNISNITVSGFLVLDKNLLVPSGSVKPGDGACKIVDNTKWMVGAVLDPIDLQGLKKGDFVKLRFSFLSDKIVDGRVEYISETEEDKAVVVISSRMFIESIYSVRKINFDIIKASYEGLRIPTEAIRVVNEQTGVFVISDSVARFRPIDIMYYDENMAIVKEADTLSKGLNIYDTLIVSGKDIYEGKIIN